MNHWYCIECGRCGRSNSGFAVGGEQAAANAEHASATDHRCTARPLVVLTDCGCEPGTCEVVDHVEGIRSCGFGAP